MKITCPSCNAQHNFELAADMRGDHYLSFKITPTPGGALSPLFVGGMMRSFERLLVSIGRDVGMTTAVVLRNLSIDDRDDSVVIDVMIMRRKET